MKTTTFEVDPWCVHESDFDLDALGETESVFALSNGHLGLRGNLDEGEPHGMPGTYLNSVYELRPLPYAEGGYGYPESGQSIINVTNGKIIRLLVNDEPFDLRYGSLQQHERKLDFRTGTLTRHAQWTSPAGDRIKVSSERLVSLTQRAVAAVSYEVEAVDQPLRVVVQSELVANEQLPGVSKDPRIAATLEAPLVSEEAVASNSGVLLMHQTRHSGLRIAAGMRHIIDGPEDTSVESEALPDVGRTTIATRLAPGQKLRVIKFLAYGWSSQRSRPAVHDQVVAALAGAQLSGWDGLLSEQRAYLDEFWAGADVEVEGDPEVQQAIRFALFHTLQAGARGEHRPIPAKGLTGPGYEGHTFWDSEMFVLPTLMYTQPAAAADALRWRHATLDLALERAAQLDLNGASFPWRTIGGQECSGYWPASTAAFHINADIADAALRYVDATDDVQFEEEVGFDLLIHTARLWRSLGHHDAQGNFRIDGVTGPDEYTALVDNNIYTNLMAQQNLRAAADLAAKYPERATQLEVTTEETASWRDAAATIYIPYDSRIEVHPQSEGFTDHGAWDFVNTTADEYPLLLHFTYFDIYRKQVVKQADLILAMQLHPNAFTMEQKRRNFAYYEAITVRDSSLSACTQAVIAAECGHMELAHDYLAEAALMDLHNLALNTSNGVHIASMGGTWIAVVAGFGGMRAIDGTLHFAPRLSSGLTKLSFRMRYKGRRLLVTIMPDKAEYSLLEGEDISLRHHGVEFTLGRKRITHPVEPIPHMPAPSQPHGRAPISRSREPAA